MIAGLIKKIIPDKAKVWLVDKVIDGTVGKIKRWFQDRFAPEPEPEEKEVVGPKTKFNTGRLDYRDIEKKKRKP